MVGVLNGGGGGFFRDFDFRGRVGHGAVMNKWREGEVEEVFSRSSGPGGQHVNKVSTAVTLRHVASGIQVTVSDSRSQGLNRATARKRLREKLAALAREEKQSRLAEAARERRRMAKRSRGTKAKMVEGKRRRAETKKLRGRVPG